MQCNTSFVIPDPKGEIVKADGNLLVKKGYDVKVIDLIDMEKAIATIRLFILKMTMTYKSL